MQLLRHLFLCLPLATLALAGDNQDFEDLLNALPEESLRVALNDQMQPQYRDGVFQHDRKAVQAVHAVNPPLATKLIIVAAKHDLVRRQNGTVPSSSSSGPAVVVPITSTMTDSAGRPTTFRTSVLAPPSTSVVVPVTTTDSRGNAVTTSRTVAGIVVSSTNSAGSLVTSVSPVPTAGQVLTTTNSDGSIVTTTNADGVASSIVLETTTLPNGDLVTITSYANVKPTGASQSDGPGGDSDLQNDATHWLRPSITFALGAAAGAVFFM